MNTPALAVSQTLRLAALPTAPGIARAFVTQVGAGLGVPDACTETAQLLASELVTNAVKQTGRVDGPPMPLPAEFVAVVSLRVGTTAGAVRLEVWDNDPTPAVLAEQSLTSEGGRGLFLVEALSREWGCYESRKGGKVVWCDVPTSDPELVTPPVTSSLASRP